MLCYNIFEFCKARAPLADATPDTEPGVAQRQ